MPISVVIVTRDRPQLLERALASIHAQGDPDVEIVVVDNRSQVPVDLPCPVIRSEVPLSAAQARNLGMEHAGGEIICFLDDDDVFLPNKFADLRAAFSDDLALDFCFGSTVHRGVAGEEVGHSAGEPEIVPFLRWRYVHVNALALRGRAAREHRFDERMTTYEDVDFIGRLMRAARGRHIPRDHAVWNRDNRPDQLTRKNWRRAWANWKLLCATFDLEIASDRDLRRFYHRKMLALALRYGDAVQVGRSLVRLSGI